MDLEKLAYTTRYTRYRRALWWLDQGVDVVPLKPHSKHLHPGYGAHKQHITDNVGASHWFLQTGANLGIVLGGRRGLAVIDWDDAKAYETWQKTLGAEITTRTEKTARGYHLFFTGVDLQPSSGGGCELLTNGVCMVTSSLHPSGVIYRVIDDAPIATLNTKDLGEFFPFLSVKQESTTTTLDKKTIRTGARVRPTTDHTDRGVITQIKQTRTTVTEMCEAGILLRPGGKNALVGLCPFHEDHHPSLWVNLQTGLWGCNKPDCPAAGVHDVINFRALRRGISNVDAIRELAREFL